MRVSLLGIRHRATRKVGVKGIKASKGFSNLSCPLVRIGLSIVVTTIFGRGECHRSLSILSLTVAFLRSGPIFVIRGAGCAVRVVAPSLRSRDGI